MFEPIQNKVVIKRKDSEAEFGSIYIPEKSRERELSGVVVAVGPRAMKEITVGSTVLFGKGDGVTLDSKLFDEPGDYIIVRDEQIRGVLNA